MKRFIVFIYLVFGIASVSALGTSVKGVVLDQATQQPLIGVNVIIEGTEMGTASDLKGEFVITDVSPGFYHVRFEMIGYRPLVKLNVRVIPDRGAFVKAELVQQAIELGEITVTRAYYQKEKDAYVSNRTVDFEEIRRDPAGIQDIQRMMQALPSVVSTTDQQNEIVIRGGAPGENLFIMDNIEISNPNHFGFLRSSGGGINMLNVLFIDRVDFLAGAFPAKYGDKVSSVMNIRLREGSREFHALDLDMSMQGIGYFAEGPLAGGRGSYMSSYRKSFLELVIRSVGLAAAPKYWDTQTKMTFDINPTNKLMLNIMHGADEFTMESENIPQNRGLDNQAVSGNQSVIGLTYKHLWRRQGLSRFTIAGTRAQFIFDGYRFTAKGAKQTFYKHNMIEWDFQAKGDFVWRLNSGLEISGGIDLKNNGADLYGWSDNDTVWTYVYSLPENPDSYAIITNETWGNKVFPIIEKADPDSTYLDTNNIWHYGQKNNNGGWDFVRVSKFDTVGVYDEWRVNKEEMSLRYGAFFQIKWRPHLRFALNLGFRVGFYEITNFSWLSPRFGLSYYLTDRSTLNFALGRHFQSTDFVILLNNAENGNLKSKYTDQVVMGVEHFFSEDTRGTVELYWKSYNDVPLPLSETTIDTADYSPVWINKGEGYSYGIELFLQKKLAKDFFGTFSYSRYIALARDVRYPEEKKYYTWDFDFRNVLTAIGGYKIPIRDPKKKQIPERGRPIRFLAKTLGAGAQEFELSFRYRYVGGKPYTPKVYNHHVRRWYDKKLADYNTKRFPPYHRFDIMLLWHYNFRRVSLVWYFNLQNVFNRDNVWELQRNADGTSKYSYQFKVLPVAGFTLEF